MENVHDKEFQLVQFQISNIGSYARQNKVARDITELMMKSAVDGARQFFSHDENWALLQMVKEEIKRYPKENTNTAAENDLHYIDCWNEESELICVIETKANPNLVVELWESFSREEKNIQYANENEEWDLDAFLELIESKGYQAKEISLGGFLELRPARAQ